MKIRTINLYQSQILFLERGYPQGITRSEEIRKAIDWYLQQADITVKDNAHIITVNLTEEQQMKIKLLVKLGQAINVSELMRTIIHDYKDYIEENEIQTKKDEPIENPKTIQPGQLQIGEKIVSVKSHAVITRLEYKAQQKQLREETTNKRVQLHQFHTQQKLRMKDRIYELCAEGKHFKTDIKPILQSENKDGRYGIIADSTVRTMMAQWQEDQWALKKLQKQQQPQEVTQV